MIIRVRRARLRRGEDGETHRVGPELLDLKNIALRVTENCFLKRLQVYCVDIIEI